MARRFSQGEKEKWVSNSPRQPKRPPIRLPAVNCNNLIEEHRFTLIGRVTNPAIQKTRALVDFFLQHWQVIGTFTGRPLGPLLFQFTFESEQDLQAILNQAPYHFKRWMFILQRWEPIVSDLFPSKISFWITIHGIPLHYWTSEALDAIGQGLGLVENKDVDNGRVRVQINGLKPLEKYLEISLAGEIKQVELEYENLDKHCFSCRSLSHEVKDCSSKPSSHNSSDQNLDISQRRTLERLEDSRRRADNRKRARFTPYEDNRGNRRPEQSYQDNHTHQGHQNYDHQSYHRAGRYDHSSDRSHSHPDRSNTVSASRARNRDMDRDSRNSRGTREPQDKLTPIRESSNVSLRSQGHRTLNPVARNIWRPVSGPQGEGGYTNSIQSQVSHTPPPQPQQEPMTSPASNPQRTPCTTGGTLLAPPSRRSALERLSDGEAHTTSGERRSALARISSPPTRVPLLHNGVANSDSGRLQEVNIQYLEEMFPYHTPEAPSGPSKPSSSRPPPNEPLIDAGMLERSPIRTLSEDRAHVSLRLGPLPDSENNNSPPMTLKSAGKKRAPPTRKIPRSPAQGISLNKRHIAKAQNSPKNRGISAAAAKKKGKAKASGQTDAAVLIPATRKKKAGFRTAPNSLP